MYFRPYPILTLFSLPALAALIWLGAWQLQRAEWKAERVAMFERQAGETPRPLMDVLCGAEPEIGQVAAANLATAGTAPVVTLRMFGQSAEGRAGWTLLRAAPAPCGAGPAMIVEAGFEAIPSETAAPLSAHVDPTRFVVAAWPTKGPFAPPNDPDANDWHWFDPASMASALGVRAIETRYYLRRFDGRLPAGLARTPPATHIGYAVTWFGMALAVIVIYGAFHARAGRLRFSARNDPP